MFEYTVTGDGRVFISWNHQPAVVLTGSRAARFLRQISGASHRVVEIVVTV
ncbi:MAG: hypothetical protein FWD75_11010 [Propionibacteriaceae bacterium]|nr:hypothetical protein [Propionibacteriaceae bacterium]